MELDYGQFYLIGGMPYDEDWDPDAESRAGDVAQSSGGIGQIGQLILVLSPHQSNIAMPLRVEVWDASPPDDLDAWQEAFEASLRVGARGLIYTSPTMSEHHVAVPVGRYRLRVTGRGFVARGWPGPTEPGDEWRLQLWVDDSLVPRTGSEPGPAPQRLQLPRHRCPPPRTTAGKRAQITERLR